MNGPKRSISSSGRSVLRANVMVWPIVLWTQVNEGEKRPSRSQRGRVP